MKFFTSDHHYYHTNVIKYCNRPFKDVEEQTQKLIYLWNSTITNQDEVYFLGDFSLNKKWVPIITPKLNGIKYLIPGNHDPVFPFRHYGKEKQNNLLRFYKDAGWIINSQFMEICIGDNEYKVLLSHLPYLPTNIDTLNFDLRYKEYRPIDQGQILLHGHLHCGKYIKNGRMIDVGIDGKNCTKIWSEKEICAIIKDDKEFIPSEQTRIITVKTDRE